MSGLTILINWHNLLMELGLNNSRVSKIDKFTVIII